MLRGGVELRSEFGASLGELIELVAERGREVIAQGALRFGERIEDTALAAQHGGQCELQCARAAGGRIGVKRYQVLGLALDEGHQRSLARLREGGEAAAQLRLPDVGGTRQKGLGLWVCALRLVEPGEAMEAVRDVGMHWPQRLLADVERTDQQRLGLAVRALGPVEHAEVIEAGRDVGMHRPQRLLADVERTDIGQLSIVHTAPHVLWTDPVKR